MEQTANNPSPENTVNPAPEPATQSEVTLFDARPQSALALPARRFTWPKWLGWAGGALAGCALLVWLMGKGAHGDHAVTRPAGIPVKTVSPRLKVLERTVTLPVSIKPLAQVEIYAKTSGYLKLIQREWTREAVGAAMAQGLRTAGPLFRADTAGWLGRFVAASHRPLAVVAQKDIGSQAEAGECLLEIEAPEQYQDIVEKESILAQRIAELEVAQTAIASHEAAVEVARAQTDQANEDILKWQEEYTYRTKQLSRFASLVVDKTIRAEVLDEKEYQAKAAKAAWESSKAKLKAVSAEVKVLASKLAAAKADLMVKETLVRLGHDNVKRARILAEYSRICAPFDGVITYRGVDVGDYVAAHSRHLMTLCAIDTVKLVAHVPERDAPWVKTGTPAHLHDIDALATWELHAKVNRIAGALDTGSRTMHVEIDLDNKDHRLLPGMYGQVTLSLQKIDKAYSVPATAVYSRKGVNYLLLVEGGVVRRQPVVIRYDDGKEVEVFKVVGDRESPLDGSERIIVSNKGEIADGQQVIAVP